MTKLQELKNTIQPLLRQINRIDDCLEYLGHKVIKKYAIRRLKRRTNALPE